MVTSGPPVQVARRLASPVGAADYGAERRTSTVPSHAAGRRPRSVRERAVSRSQQLARNVNKGPAQNRCGGEHPGPGTGLGSLHTAEVGGSSPLAPTHTVVITTTSFPQR